MSYNLNDSPVYFSDVRPMFAWQSDLSLLSSAVKALKDDGASLGWHRVLPGIAALCLLSDRGRLERLFVDGSSVERDALLAWLPVLGDLTVKQARSLGLSSSDVLNLCDELERLADLPAPGASVDSEGLDIGVWAGDPVVVAEAVSGDRVRAAAEQLAGALAQAGGRGLLWGLPQGHRLVEAAELVVQAGAGAGFEGGRHEVRLVDFPTIAISWSPVRYGGRQGGQAVNAAGAPLFTWSVHVGGDLAQRSEGTIMDLVADLAFVLNL